MDIAKEILANVEAHPTQKALAQHAFEVAPHERALKGMLDRINIPLPAKADLWDAKKNASIDPKLHKMLDIANLPADLLDKAESHPNVLKALLTESKPSEAKSGAKEPKTGSKSQEKGNKAASGATEAGGNAENEDLGAGTDASALPPLPPGHIHFKSSIDSSEHYIPHQNLGLAAQIDPGLKILRTA